MMHSGLSDFVNQNLNLKPGPTIEEQSTREQRAKRARIVPEELKKMKTVALQPGQTPPAASEVHRNARVNATAPKDTFGTDYDGSTGTSIELAEDNQVRNLHDDSEASASSGFDAHGGFDTEGPFYDEDGYHNTTETAGQTNQHMQQQHNMRDNNSNGYPTTTSGRLDQDDFDEESTDGGQSYEGEDDGEGDIDQETTPKRPVQIIYSAPQQTQHPQNAVYPQARAQANTRKTARQSQAPPRQIQNLSVQANYSPSSSSRAIVLPRPKSPTDKLGFRGISQSQGVANQQLQVPLKSRPLQSQNQAPGPVARHNPPSKGPKPNTHQTTQHRQHATLPTLQNVNQTIHQPTLDPEPSLEEEVFLDYEPSELETMPYDRLKGESFDLDPNAQPFQFDRPLGLSLNDKLPIVRTLSSDEKARFFASLSLAQWEEAGDWFLDQLSNVVTKIRDARKERRLVAETFESEVFRRHQNVESRKRTIEQVMVDMRSNGVGVLDRAGNNPLKKKREE